MASNNQNDASMTITLEFDDGKTKKCDIDGVFDADGQDYIALVPRDQTGDVYIYKYIEEDDGDYYLEDETNEARFKKAVEQYEDLRGHQRQ
ncbi:MAG: DUF1292 domain-containing protein [Anaerovoracaceae bacterium]|jgi:hypothetical protein